MAIADDYAAIQKRRLALGGERWPPHDGPPPEEPKEPEQETQNYFYGFLGAQIPCP